MTYHRELDGLRWLAVTTVLISHLPMIEGALVWNGVKYVGAGLRFGYLGVDVFFVLSGFLITRILYAQKSLPLKPVLVSFFAKRVLRILPIYYLCILYSWLVLGVAGDEVLANVTFLSNYYYAFFDHPSPLRHTWSLAVEEQFYLLWPFIILLVPSTRLSRFIIILSLAIAGLSTLALLISASEEVMNKLFVRATSFRLLSLSAGALLAIHYNRLFELDRRLPLLLAVLIMPVAQAAVRYFEVPFAQGLLVPMFTVWSVAIFLTVLLYANEKSGGQNLLYFLFNNAVVVYIGRISYGLYLYHLVILHQLDLRESYRPDGAETMEVLVGVGLCLLVASVSFEILEKPLLRLKKHVSVRTDRMAHTQHSARNY